VVVFFTGLKNVPRTVYAYLISKKYVQEFCAPSIWNVSFGASL